MRPPIKLDLGPYATGSLQVTFGDQFDSVEGLHSQSIELILRLVEEGVKSYANSFKPGVVYGECSQFHGLIQQTSRSFISLRLTVRLCHCREGSIQLADYLDFVLAQSVAGAYRLMRRAHVVGIFRDPEEFSSYCDYLETVLIHEPEDLLEISDLLEVGTQDDSDDTI